jgi:hypothetical protein
VPPHQHWATTSTLSHHINTVPPHHHWTTTSPLSHLITTEPSHWRWAITTEQSTTFFKSFLQYKHFTSRGLNNRPYAAALIICPLLQMYLNLKLKTCILFIKRIFPQFQFFRLYLVVDARLQGQKFPS